MQAYKVDAGSVEAVNTFAPELLKLGTVKAIIANAADGESTTILTLRFASSLAL